MFKMFRNILNSVIPDYKLNKILMIDLKMLGLFWYNPFKVSLIFYFIFNTFYVFFIIIPTLFFLVSNAESGYEIVSQSISELYFEIMKLTFNSVFLFNRREIASIIQDLITTWRKSEYDENWNLHKFCKFLSLRN